MDAPSVVLVVDDDPSVRELLRVLLQGHILGSRYRVHTVADGRAALAAAQAEPPALVLTDLGLPEMHGLELCQRLKADPRTADIPVVAISGLEMRAEATAAGCAAFLHKPVRLADLRTVVERFLTP